LLALIIKGATISCAFSKVSSFSLLRWRNLSLGRRPCLVRSKSDCAELAALRVGAILPRGDADDLFESFREVTLIIKAGGDGYVRELRIGFKYLAAGEFYALATHHLTDGGMIITAEFARQRHRMDAYYARHLAEG